jgi:diguanylate cyclase (GGDEF)-like protein/PAS domain S-box-containing protein
MSADNQSDHANHDHGATDSAAPISTSASDPLAEVSTLKHRVGIGVYAAILATEPFYYFVLHYSLPQLLGGLFVGLVIAFSAIQLAFGQMFKLRKRSAYPNILLVELGSASGPAEATQPALATINRLMGTSASFLACLEADGALTVKAVSGVSSDEARAMLNIGDTPRVLADLRPGRCALPRQPVAKRRPTPADRLVLVPVISLQQTLGILGIVGTRHNKDLMDDQLLQAVGMALGLSLEALRQKEELREGRERLRTVISGASIVLFATDADGVFTLMEGKGLDSIGVAPSDVIGRSVFEVYQFRPEALNDYRRALAGEEVTTTGEVAGVLFEGRLSPIWKDSGEVAGIIGVTWDVTDQRRAERALRDSEERNRTLFESARDVIYTVDQTGTLTSLNPAFETMTGWSRNDWIGKNFAPIVHPEDLPEVVDRFQRLLQGGMADPETHEWRVRTKSGDYLMGEFAPVPQVRDGKVVGAIGFVRDITERRKAEETIRRLAYHDALTGLPNRALFEDRLRLALAQAQRSRHMLAVMFLDLDRFKIVNDTLGHAAGDELLKDVAGDLSDVVRDCDTVARIGGDEFIFLLTGLGTAEDAIVVAERILARLRVPRLLAEKEFRVSTSIGITVFPRDGASAEDLLRSADTAMYRAKERGRDNYQFYTPSMEAGLLDRLSMENDLRRAIEREEMLVYYQPVMDIASGRIVGSEALLRWQHPDRGIVSPEEFIPLAEESGMITEIGEWVLRAACLQNKAWQRPGSEPLWVTVNVSARQLEREGLVLTVLKILRETGLPPQCLRLEITEGAMMKNVQFIIAMLEDLRDMGVGIAVDDFGTGYSSLSYLKRFPISTIKIDRSFVRDIVTDANDAAIVTTVITMAHNLHLKVVAEGVETEDQLEFLRRNGCDEFQGYLISQPVTAAEFEKMLPEGKPQRAKIIPMKSA